MITPTQIADTQALTPRAREFVRKNRTAAVVSAAWLDEHGHDVTAGPETGVKLRLRFEDGTQRTLQLTDMQTLWAAKVEPRWHAFTHSPEGTPQ